MSVDVSEVVALGTELSQVAASVVGEVDKIVREGAKGLAEQMRTDARSSAHFAQVGRAISYDRATKGSQVAWEVGPDRDRGGAAGLAGAYLGWPNGGGATLPLDRPADDAGEALRKALGDLLGGLL